ncbi:uncharacterized protein [Oscarella lobularis]|uniref:uncharacterized protein n=1 Tax=Oscarella lobularis TaxID=121494 RepID=UPI003313A3E0
MEASARPREASLGYGPSPPAPKGLWKALIGVPLVDGLQKSKRDEQMSNLAHRGKKWTDALERERKFDQNLTKRYQDGMTAMHLFFDFLRVLHKEETYFMDETDSKTIKTGFELISRCENGFVHIRDRHERNFFHHLAGANVHPSLTQFILTRLPRQNFEIQESGKATDDSGRTVLDYSFDSKNPRPENVMQLLNFGARFNDKKLMVTDVSELDKLQYKVTQTLAYREQPENVCIELVAHLREQAESQTYDGTAKDRFMTVSEELEDLTVAMLGDATRDTETFHLVSEDHFNLAKKKGLKKYLASGGAQQYVNRKWYGLNLSGKSSKSYIPFTHDLMLGDKGGKFLSDRLTTAVRKGLPWYHYTWLIFLFLTQTLFYMLSFSLLSNRLRVLHIPAVAFGAQTVMYCLFVGLLLARVQMHGILTEGAPWSGSETLEVFVLLFCVGFILDLIVNSIRWSKRRCQSGRCARSMTPTFQWENVHIITGYIINAFLFLSLLGYVTTGAIVLNWKNGTNHETNSTARNVTVENKVRVPC